MVECEEKPVVDSADAVADAMMVVAYGLMEKEMPFSREIMKRERQTEDEFVRSRVVRATSGYCLQGSAMALAYLKQKYDHLFDRMGVIVAFWDAESAFRNDAWDFHAYFVVRDVGKVWFAGSPANYQGEKLDCLTNIFQDKSLEAVLYEIQRFEGGLWPNEEYVLGKLVEKPSLDGTYKKGTLKFQKIFVMDG